MIMLKLLFWQKPECQYFYVQNTMHYFSGKATYITKLYLASIIAATVGLEGVDGSRV